MTTLAVLGVVAVAFDASTGAGVVVLFIAGPLWWFFAILCTRVLLELVVSILKLAQNSSELLALERSRAIGGR